MDNKSSFEFFPNANNSTSLESLFSGKALLLNVIQMYERFIKEVSDIKEDDLKDLLFPVTFSLDDLLKALQDGSFSFCDPFDVISIMIKSSDPFDKYYYNLAEGMGSKRRSVIGQLENSLTEARWRLDSVDYTIELLTKADAERKAREDAEVKADEERKARQEAETKATALKEQLLENPSFVLSTTNNTQRKLRTTKTTSLSADIMGNAKVSIEEFSLILANYEKGISTTAKITLDIFLKEYCLNETSDGLIQLSLRDYMELRGLNDPKTARKQVLDNIEEMKNIRFSSTEFNKISKKKEFMGGIDLYGGTGLIQKGIIRFRFNPDYLRFRNLTHYYINYPVEIYKTNIKQFPHSYYFGCYIAEYYRMNEGTEQVNTIAIKTLLEYTPTIPTYEEISKGNRHFFNRIIEPSIRNLDQLESMGYDFYPKGKYTEADRIEDPLSFFKGEEGNKAFFDSVIRIDYSNFPTNPERLLKRKKHLSKQATAPKKTTKKGGETTQKGG
ncbi:MAG: cell envelope integrity protein TolA [Eubacteriales bacterium]